MAGLRYGRLMSSARDCDGPARCDMLNTCHAEGLVLATSELLMMAVREYSTLLHNAVTQCHNIRRCDMIRRDVNDRVPVRLGESDSSRLSLKPGMVRDVWSSGFSRICRALVFWKARTKCLPTASCRNLA